MVAARRCRLAVVGVVLAGTSTACTGGVVDAGSTDRRDIPGEARTSGRSELVPLVAPRRADTARWARGNIPRAVPEPRVALPSLLDDLPGRAVVASYVPRPATSFDGEAMEFYGVDGRWRRLDLGDLDLPVSGWDGDDTYGAGALSPDGRWWAGPMYNGMFLLDLRDGTTTVLDGVADAGTGVASFGWSPDSDELVLILEGNSTRVSVPDLAVRSFPRPGNRPRVLADGGWVECAQERRIVVRCDTYGPSGDLVEQTPVPPDLRQRWAGPWADPLAVSSESVFYDLSGSPYGPLRDPVEVIRADADFEADTRLILPAGGDVDSVGEPINGNVLGLSAIDSRLLLAWVVDLDVVVKMVRPGEGLTDTVQDWWDISFANDLVRVR